jgi:hypothetical protein
VLRDHKGPNASFTFLQVPISKQGLTSEFVKDWSNVELQTSNFPKKVPLWTKVSKKLLKEQKIMKKTEMHGPSEIPIDAHIYSIFVEL